MLEASVNRGLFFVINLLLMVLLTLHAYIYEL